MPKATVRANAQTLPKKSQSSPGDPDRKLLALIDEANTLADLEDEAEKQVLAIARRTRLPKYPSCAFGALPHLTHQTPDNCVYRKEDLKALRFDLPLAQAWVRRVPKIVEALERYDAECERIHEESGYRAAEDRLDQLRIKHARLFERIVDTPARSIRGITAKLTFAGQFITVDQVKEHYESIADAIAMSAAVDASRIDGMPQ